MSLSYKLSNPSELVIRCRAVPLEQQMDKDVVKRTFNSVSTAVELTDRQLSTLLTTQRESWSPAPRAHSTETAFSHTASNRAALSHSPAAKRRKSSPFGPVRNEGNRSRTNIRRADLHSKKSLTDKDQPTSGVETALGIASRSSSQVSLPGILVYQSTSMTRSPAASNLAERSPAVTSSTKTAMEPPSGGQLAWDTPRKIGKTESPVSTARESARDMIVERMADGKIKVTIMMDITAPGGRIGLAGKAPDGMRVQRVTVNGAAIYSGL